MAFDFDTIPNRRATHSLKWRTYPEDVLPMWVADMDFRSPPAVLDSLHRAVDHGIFGYPDGIHGETNELVGLRRLIVDRLAARYRWQVSTEDLVLLPGVIAGFNKACAALFRPDGAILVQPPVYPPILQAAEHVGMVRQDAPLLRNSDGSYEIDWDSFSSAITKETRVFLLCNPHNPVGRVFTRLELERMAQICVERGVVICSDEIHCDLVYRGHPHTPIASISPEIAQNTITLMSPSKTYNLSGLQCAFAVIQNPELRKRFQKAGEGLVGWVNLMGLVAAQAAFGDGPDWLSQLLAYLESNRDYAYDYVRRELGPITMSKPEGTYLAWLDCRQTDIPGDPYHFFLEQARVGLNDGKPFGIGGDGFLRFNFGCPRGMLSEALERMKNALRDLPATEHSGR